MSGEAIARLKAGEYVTPPGALSAVDMLIALSKEFPASDWHAAAKGQKCSRWGCGKPATKSRSVKGKELGACSEHYNEMKKG